MQKKKQEIPQQITYESDFFSFRNKKTISNA